MNGGKTTFSPRLWSVRTIICAEERAIGVSRGDAWPLFSQTPACVSIRMWPNAGMEIVMRTAINVTTISGSIAYTYISIRT